MQNYRILCVDDEVRSVTALKKLCLQLNPDHEVYTFTDPAEVPAFVKEHPVDLALLDIDMPGTNGLHLAGQLHAVLPRLNIIMTTAYAQYALDAFAENCSGYLLKPVTAEALAAQLRVLRFPVEAAEPEPELRIRCFGDFEVFYGKEPVRFAYSKTKELLAYLVSRDGALCSNQQISVILWEDDEDHTSYLKQLKKDLTDTLTRVTGREVIVSGRGFTGVKKEAVSCDFFDYMGGKHAAFLGEFMEQYSWAEELKSNLLYQAGRSKW